MNTGESMTHECLVDLFSALDNDLRLKILENLNKIIPAMEQDLDKLQEAEPEPTMLLALGSLKASRVALEQAHKEYSKLFVRTNDGSTE